MIRSLLETSVIDPHLGERGCILLGEGLGVTDRAVLAGRGSLGRRGRELISLINEVVRRCVTMLWADVSRSGPAARTLNPKP